MAGKVRVHIKLSQDEATYLQQVAAAGNLSITELMLRSTRYVVREMQKSASEKSSKDTKLEDTLTGNGNE